MAQRVASGTSRRRLAVTASMSPCGRVLLPGGRIRAVWQRTVPVTAGETTRQARLGQIRYRSVRLDIRARPPCRPHQTGSRGASRGQSSRPAQVTRAESPPTETRTAGEATRSARLVTEPAGVPPTAPHRPWWPVARRGRAFQQEACTPAASRRMARRTAGGTTSTDNWGLVRAETQPAQPRQDRSPATSRGFRSVHPVTRPAA